MLLEEFKANVDCTDARNNTPLHYAIMNGNLKLVRVLFSKFPRIDISNEEGQTALNLQMRMDLKIVKDLRLNALGTVNLSDEASEKDSAGPDPGKGPSRLLQLFVRNSPLTLYSLPYGNALVNKQRQSSNVSNQRISNELNDNSPIQQMLDKLAEVGP